MSSSSPTDEFSSSSPVNEESLKKALELIRNHDCDAYFMGCPLVAIEVTPEKCRCIYGCPDGSFFIRPCHRH